MKRQHPTAPLVLAILGLALAARPVAAGEPHGTDFFAGYSFAKIGETNRHGADLALGFDLPGPICGFADTSFHWGSQEGVGITDLTLMAGPGVRFGKRGGTVFFVRALAGLVQDKSTIGILDVDISETSNRLGVLAGGGVDFRVASKLAARLQGDYLWNDVEEGKASGFRASAGIVYRFGISQ